MISLFTTFKRNKIKVSPEKYVFISDSKIGKWYMPLDMASICHARHLGCQHAVHKDSLYLDKSELEKLNSSALNHTKQGNAHLLTGDIEKAKISFELAQDNLTLQAFNIKNFDNERFLYNLCTYYTVLLTDTYLEDETTVDTSILKLKMDELSKDEDLKKKLQIWFIQLFKLSKGMSIENFLLLMEDREAKYKGLRQLLKEKEEALTKSKKKSTNSSERKRKSFW